MLGKTKKKEGELVKLEDVSEVKVQDPLTGETRIVKVDRTGMTEKKLILDLADPTLTRDRKDFAVSMYLYERGKENTSFVVDLMRYKGAHTKETRIFKSQMRFDFEALVDMIAGHLRDQAKRTGEMFGVDIADERSAYMAWLKEHKEDVHSTYFDFYRYLHEGEELPWRMERIERQFIAQAIFDLDRADDLVARRKSIMEAREREKGKGIYLDSAGKPYLHDDPQLDEALQRDRELTADAAKDHD